MIEELKKQLKTIDRVSIHTSDARWYKVGNGRWKPSITTVLGLVLNKGIAFETWLGNQPSYKIACQERDEAAARGTDVHKACEDLLNGETIDGTDSKWGDEFNKRLMSFELWVKNTKPNIVALEYSMYSNNVPFSGTCDIVADIPDKGLSIIDIKTGQSNESHGLQLSGYKLLWDELFPEYPIQHLYGLYLKGGWITKIEPQLKEYKFEPNILVNIMELFNWSNKGKVPSNQRVIKTKFKIKDKSEQLKETP
jgi:hypothetical protein